MWLIKYCEKVLAQYYFHYLNETFSITLGFGFQLDCSLFVWPVHIRTRLTLGSVCYANGNHGNQSRYLNAYKTLITVLISLLKLSLNSLEIYLEQSSFVNLMPIFRKYTGSKRLRLNHWAAGGGDGGWVGGFSSNPYQLM